MSAVLVTGACGHLGKAIARRLASEGRDVVLWGRARPPAAAGGHCTIALGDLRSEAAFAGVDPDGIGAIVHAAAITAFGVEEAEATRVNVEGTRKVLDFARRCPRLESCLLASTLYATGLRAGAVDEEAFERPAEFANHYEESKWRMERLAREEFADVPWIVARIGTIAAEDASGAVVQRNALHNTLLLFLHGLLPVLAGRPDTRLYMTTTEFAARACVSLLRREHAHGFFHVSDAFAGALTLGETLAIARARLTAGTGVHGRRVTAPRFCDLESLRLLAEGARRFSPVMDAALSSMAPFAPQLYSDKRVANARLRAAFPGMDPPRMGEVLPRVCDRLLEGSRAA